ncbi:MAG: NADH-quinone oxidoreductase subunit L [Pseudomonadota bacterium]|nr:NADH-quinone oxidoreductase subunit L [Pseudomonadota bacterium]
MLAIYLLIVLAPLAAATVVGLFGARLGRTLSHTLAIGGVGLSFVLSLLPLAQHVFGDAPAYERSLYTWLEVGGLRFEIGLLVDALTAIMMSVVTFVSLMVHVYTIGYMREDPGYTRFFSFISLFTFAMLTLVMANNFLQLFFGWEAVGLVSYLLIGFWYDRPSAVYANLKAFLVNRVGDFGFLLGIAGVLWALGSLNYLEAFAGAPQLVGQTIEILPGREWSVLSVICILLFIGAMGKSAQAPLHVWLPDSMEGPTPISALIHAATMVTAGIFLVARMSPLYELSEAALGFVLVIGAITALFMGLLGVVQNDIKRVIAYSTLSQLGYMTVALGVSAYSAAIFHLMTHAFFKALLFLAAGSVIIAMHHEQDMRKMGGLRRHMPITYWTCLLGALALIGFPGFAGFFSKDSIIEAVHLATLPGAELAYWSVLLGVFVTALYTFRMLFLVFHGEPRMDAHTREHLHESPAVVTLPLVLLAIPSVVIGALAIGPLLHGEVFDGVIFVAPEHDVIGELGSHYHGILAMITHAFLTPILYFALAGVAAAWLAYIASPGLPATLRRFAGPVYYVLERKYWFDELYAVGLAGGGRLLGGFLSRRADAGWIDGVMVNGTVRRLADVAAAGRRLQSGFLYHYAFAMIIGVSVLLGWLLFLR